MINLSKYLLLFFCIAVVVNGAVPRIITYQGILTDASGNPVKDSTYKFTFAISESPVSTAAPIWTESLILPVSEGKILTTLGETTPITCSFDKQYWLSISVLLSNADVSLGLIKLHSAPYAFRADTANVALHVQGLADSLAKKADTDYVSSILAADTVYTYSPGSPPNAVYVTSDGKVGINTKSPGNSTLAINGGDMLLSEKGSGVIFHNNAGTAFRLTVSDSGKVLLDSLK